MRFSVLRRYEHHALYRCGPGAQNPKRLRKTVKRIEIAAILVPRTQNVSEKPGTKEWAVKRIEIAAVLVSKTNCLTRVRRH